jgi:hypothetical protein
LKEDRRDSIIELYMTYGIIKVEMELAKVHREGIMRKRELNQMTQALYAHMNNKRKKMSN